MAPLLYDRELLIPALYISLLIFTGPAIVSLVWNLRMIVFPGPQKASTKIIKLTHPGETKKAA